MHSSKGLKRLLAVACKVATFLSSVVAYESNRAWLIQTIGCYYTGYAEGIGSLLIIVYIITKYGDAIDEIILGLRAKGRNNRKRKDPNRRKLYRKKKGIKRRYRQKMPDFPHRTSRL